MLDGHVLVVGGSDGTSDLATAEIFDPASQSFFATGGLQTPRSGHTAVLLPNNNQVLIAGGQSAGTAVASAELYADWRDGFLSAPESDVRAAHRRRRGAARRSRPRVRRRRWSGYR